MNEKRFQVVYSQGTLDSVRILQDMKTGVHYLETRDGNSGGLTVLVGRDGKPIVDFPED